jgi:hypothetical protein
MVGMAWITFRIDSHARAARGCGRARPLITPSATTPRTCSRGCVQVKGLESDALSVHVMTPCRWSPVVTAFRREEHELSRFRRQSLTTLRARVGITVRQTLFLAVREHDDRDWNGTRSGAGSYQALQGRLTAGDLLVVLAYVAAGLQTARVDQLYPRFRSGQPHRVSEWASTFWTPNRWFRRRGGGEPAAHRWRREVRDVSSATRGGSTR